LLLSPEDGRYNLLFKYIKKQFKEKCVILKMFVSFCCAAFVSDTFCTYEIFSDSFNIS